MSTRREDLPFVLDPPAEPVTAARIGDLDLYPPKGAAGPLPAVVYAHGPIPEDAPVRPRDWPVYKGYGQLAAASGLVGVTTDLGYPGVPAWPAAADRLRRLIETARARPEVDADRIAVWAFSGGGLLVGDWLADSPPWLRCLALSYPLLPVPQIPGVTRRDEPVRPGRPIVLTRVGLERPEIQATVDAFLADAAATNTAVELIEVPDGHHAFDVVDHAPRSRDAVTEAMAAVHRHLLRDGPG